MSVDSNGNVKIQKGGKRTQLIEVQTVLQNLGLNGDVRVSASGS
jgi:hypothetical protein